jgi:hypothetical protein
MELGWWDMGGGGVYGLVVVEVDGMGWDDDGWDWWCVVRRGS